MSDEQQTPAPQNGPSQLKDLIAKGKEQGFLTYAEVNDHLPEEIVDPEQVEDIINMINDMGIPVHEVAPDTESLVLSDASATDDNAAEEAFDIVVQSNQSTDNGWVCLDISIACDPLTRSDCIGEKV